MSERFNYGSVLAGHMNRFLETKVAAGCDAMNTKWILKEFDDYAMGIGLEEPRITRELVEGWRETRVNDSARTLRAKYSVWNQLARCMNRCGAQCHVPQMPRRPKSDFAPYIFTQEEVCAIFSEMDRAVMADAHMDVGLFALPALFRVLYGTGMRVSEATSLKNGDVMAGERCILVRKTKNKMERIVPVSESLGIVLEQYERHRNMMPVRNVAAATSPYFIKPDGTCIQGLVVLNWFKRAYMRCGIHYIGNHWGPRVHDLRHTFACHALARMADSGMDLYTALPILSCMMGHKSVESTEQYVRLTSARYPGMLDMCSGLNSYVLPKRKDGEDGR